MKYYCPDCKVKALVKQVYTEERCLNYDCEYVNHHPHKSKLAEKADSKEEGK